MNDRVVQKIPVKLTSQAIPRGGRSDDRKIAFQGMQYQCNAS